MSLDEVGVFVQHLMKSLCRKFSLQEGAETTVADKLSEELLEFSRHFQDYVLTEIYRIPAPLITSQDLFAVFLGSVCSDICDLDEIDERKFFILCSFITNLMTLSFMMPCYRLIEDIERALTFQLKVRLYFSFYSDAKVIFEILEGRIPQLISNRIWIRAKLHQLKRFIQKAAAASSHGLENQPCLASRMRTVSDMQIHKSTNEAESVADESCPFCESNCKAFLNGILNC